MVARIAFCSNYDPIDGGAAFNTNVTDDELTSDSRCVVSFDVLAGGAKWLQVRSRHNVLARGGLEYPRILLIERAQNPKDLARVTLRRGF